jgi:hypothetical protein
MHDDNDEEADERRLGDGRRLPAQAFRNLVVSLGETCLGKLFSLSYS